MCVCCVSYCKFWCQDPVTGEQFYELHYKVLDSYQYGGVPQSRNRVYIVGVHKPGYKFLWPDQTPAPNLDAVLDSDVGDHSSLPTTATELQNLAHCMGQLTSDGVSLWANAVGDIGTGFSARVTHNYAPCLTASRSRSNGYWIFSRWRRFTLQEFYRLQGMPADRLVLPHGVTERQMRGMVGNGWTVTVVASIFDRMLHVCGLTERPRGFELGSGEPGTIWG